MVTKIPDRLIWAVEELAVKSGDLVLEIGCGTGVAASLICSQLTKGRLTAIDRSASMISAARRRNRVHVRLGKAVFHNTTLADADFGRNRFDKALAVNVNVFWLQPAAELEVLRKVLRPKGVVCLVYQLPAASKMERVTQACSRFLREHGFSGIQVRIKELRPVPAVRISARAGAI